MTTPEQRRGANDLGSDSLGAEGLASVREKLTDLEKYFPDKTPHFYAYARYLSGRLNELLNPTGFVIATQLALYDLSQGINGFTREPIDNQAVGLPPIVYSMFELDTPRLARAVLPTEFADGVDAFLKKVAELTK